MHSRLAFLLVAFTFAAFAIAHPINSQSPTDSTRADKDAVLEIEKKELSAKIDSFKADMKSIAAGQALSVKKSSEFDYWLKRFIRSKNREIKRLSPDTVYVPIVLPAMVLNDTDAVAIDSTPKKKPGFFKRLFNRKR